MGLNNSYLFGDDCLLLTWGATQHEAKDHMECKISMVSPLVFSKPNCPQCYKNGCHEIANHKSDNQPNLVIQDHVITQSKKIKYLGVVLDHRLNMNAHVKKIKQKYTQ